jgi:hypothetical protein
MNDSRDTVPDSRRSRLRATIAVIQRELARLPADITNDNRATPADSLRASVADLVQQLALGPEPEYRTCPACQRIDMRAATLCGHCWTKLPPIVPAAAVGSLRTR